MARFVVLRHDLPDGTHHFDWLLERPPAHEDAHGQPASALLTIRTDRRPGDAAAAPGVTAHRLPDHRHVYLAYEGPIGRGRGSVRRTDRGWGRLIEETPTLVRFLTRLAGPTLAWRLSRTGQQDHGPAWLLTLE